MMCMDSITTFAVKKNVEKEQRCNPKSVEAKKKHFVLIEGFESGCEESLPVLKDSTQRDFALTFDFMEVNCRSHFKKQKKVEWTWQVQV